MREYKSKHGDCMHTLPEASTYGAPAVLLVKMGIISTPALAPAGTHVWLELCCPVWAMTAGATGCKNSH